MTLTAMHVCPYPGCDIQVPRSRLACRRHWYVVAPETRQRVWSAYRRRDRAAHIVAVQDAIDEMRQHSEAST